MPFLNSGGHLRLYQATELHQGLGKGGAESAKIHLKG